ncbi:DUF2513 domain-containing protein [Anatilimnocola floriformis]|uniref:DUF2513 domain-containing protein n=1 Tax=Anatilimnocola floriformis TaxID=2948575 RepID=UPI0020C23C97|nr:DUF2513 domain-containing protein [Anatilimnocola floriformis]
MKRDMDAVRSILAMLEESDGQPDFRPLITSTFTVRHLSYHLYLIHDAGLAIGIEQSNLGGGDFPFVLLTHLTNAGHDFLEAARNDSQWNKAKEAALSSGAGLTLNILTQTLGIFAMGAVDSWLRR